MATVIIVANGGVAASNVFTVYFRRDGNVLADREAEDILGVWQGETITKTRFNYV